MRFVLLIALAVIFAIQAIRSNRLVTSALWLAGVSVMAAIVFYLLGAHLAAVIELSVGAGLVTVLFVFAIAIAGEEPITMNPLVSRLLAGGLVFLAVASLAGLIILPSGGGISAGPEPSAVDTLWKERSLDVLVQVVLIFSGVLGMLALLAESKAPLQYPIAEQIAARREKELEMLEEQSMEKDRV